MSRPIGYYVHHRGAGHAARARAITPGLDRPCTLIGTLDARAEASTGPWLDLPDDRIGLGEGVDGESERPQAMHYAPCGIVSIRRRMAAIAAWIEAHDPVMMVVDVSVEVALFARLLSVPTVVVRLAGDRTDAPHLEAFRAAERLLAPFPAALDDGRTPDWVRRKTIYAGFLAAPAASVGAARPGVATIVVVFGQGGQGGSIAALSAAARALPDHRWIVLGPVAGRSDDAPPNLDLRGWVEDIGPVLADASLVIGSGGDGVIAAVAASGKRFICIPEDRPFEEQRVKAEALQRLGAAIHHPRWEGTTDWAALIRRGMDLDPQRLADLAEPDALARTARVLNALATALDARRSGVIAPR